MNILLDTHTLIWFAEDDQQLSQIAKNAIESADNISYVSVATLWEMAIKKALNKLQIKQSLPDLLKSLQANGFRLLDIRPIHAIQVENLPNIHKDPFDRILIAQAQVEQYTFVSNEALFDQYSVIRLW